MPFSRFFDSVDHSEVFVCGIVLKPWVSGVGPRWNGHIPVCHDFFLGEKYINLCLYLLPCFQIPFSKVHISQVFVGSTLRWSGGGQNPRGVGGKPKGWLLGENGMGKGDSKCWLKGPLFWRPRPQGAFVFFCWFCLLKRKSQIYDIWYDSSFLGCLKLIQ